ncbi:MAG: T9SS type A sorting domain-containing protein [Bacteroidota bacterium]
MFRVWGPSATDYPLSMTVVADLRRDGLPHAGEATVAALSGGTVVGLGQARYVEALDAYRVFLTVYSDGRSGEPLQLNVYDPTTDLIYPDVAEVTFQANAHLGTVAEPFQLTYGLQADAVTDPEGETPTSFALQAAYPNPFNPMTTIPYAVPQRERVVLDVYDSLGRRVARLADGIHTAGTYTARFDATGLSSGIYFARMRAGRFSAVQRVVLLK